MSLLRAIDEAIEVRTLLHRLGEQLEALDTADEVKRELLELYYPAWDSLSRVIEEVEAAIVPSGLKVAVTFVPAAGKEGTVGEEEAGYRIPRHGGDPRGTMILPSEPFE